MDMSMYTPREYEEIINELSPIISRYELDPVTVASLIQGSVDFDESELPTASIAIINRKDPAKSVSIKTGNVKLGLRYALESIFVMKTVVTMKDIWLVLAIINAVLHFLGDMKKELGEDEATVLFAIYRLQRPDIERISNYISNCQNPVFEIKEKINIEKALKNLEDINTIRLEDGKYVLNEIIVI